MSESKPLAAGFVLFPNVTQLDLTGPYEVFARMPRTNVTLVGPSRSAIASEHGLAITADVTFDDAPPFDIICVPGGVGVNAMMEDARMLTFLRAQAAQARLVTSVCTGALLLGAAGLLSGYRATTHWLSLGLLPLFGAIPVTERVVMDRNRVTGGGVTAGIDFGLAIARELFGDTVAQEIQLMLEYDPAPPLVGGSVRTAPPAIVAGVRHSRERVQAERRRIAERAASRLAES